MESTCDLSVQVGNTFDRGSCIFLQLLSGFVTVMYVNCDGKHKGKCKLKVKLQKAVKQKTLERDEKSRRNKIVEIM